MSSAPPDPEVAGGGLGQGETAFVGAWGRKVQGGLE